MKWWVCYALNHSIRIRFRRELTSENFLQAEAYHGVFMLLFMTTLILVEAIFICEWRQCFIYLLYSPQLNVVQSIHKDLRKYASEELNDVKSWMEMNKKQSTTMKISNFRYKIDVLLSSIIIKRILHIHGAFIMLILVGEEPYYFIINFNAFCIHNEINLNSVSCWMMHIIKIEIL